jgi:hypothetical protein
MYFLNRIRGRRHEVHMYFVHDIRGRRLEVHMYFVHDIRGRRHEVHMYFVHHIRGRVCEVGNNCYMGFRADCLKNICIFCIWDKGQAEKVHMYFRYKN